jgi:quercetin dioxygenase-like cupin family protein
LREWLDFRWQIGEVLKMYATKWLILAIFNLFFGRQDAMIPDHKIVTIAFENDRIRVLRVHFEPHEKLEMHSHPALLLLPLTPNSRRVFSPDGKQQDMTSKAGDVAWREPLSHGVENLGDSFENIEIEFKKADAPGVTVPLSEAGKNTPSTDPMQVEREPHHKILFENQYTRVLEVQLPPGDTLQFHTHSHDNLSVRLSGGRVQNQFQGSEWGAPADVQPGAVAFAVGSNKPYTHRVKNLGSVTYHVIDVELLP